MENLTNEKYQKETPSFPPANPSNNAECQKTPSKKEKTLSNEQRIGFLNQCKLELSAEVIRWKEESVKQKKENEYLVQKIEELQSFSSSLAKKNEELQTSLFLSWEENNRLRMRTAAIGEENSILHEKLSKSKFHSYPWIERKCSSASKDEQNDGTPVAEETWEEVSRKLFQQMQKEMREMQKLSRTLAERDKLFERVENPGVRNSHIKDNDGTQVLQEIVNSVANQTENLKQRLKYQNEKLYFLLNEMSQGAQHQQVANSNLKPLGSTVEPDEDGAVTSINEDKNHSRPSDETFRAYFTQQLCKSVTDDRKVTQVYLNRDEDFADRNNNEKVLVLTPKKQHRNIKPVEKVSLGVPQEKRLCPICEVAFAKDVPDREFEAHVVEHLESFSATLLDQYEMV